MHPTERQLIDYLLETGLPRGERGMIQHHLDGHCPECARVVAQFRELVELMRTDECAEPPAEWVERAKVLGRPSPWVAKLGEWGGKLQQEIGRLVFDSFAASDLATAGVRNVETERRMRFESGQVELDLRVEPHGRGGVVTGQFVKLRPDLEPLGNARYLVTAGDADAITGTADDFGEFTESVPDLSSLRIRVIAEDRIATFEVPDPVPPDE
jgi:hypothetical protein